MVESMLTRRDFVTGVAFEARLDAVETDQRLRLRKPSLRPPRLLDLECVLEPRRGGTFRGEMGSSSRAATGSEIAVAWKGS